jgi:pimeloyl-ACP methyl ester carboxylesterase
LLLNHGWPGTFLEFIPLIDSLISVGNTSTGRSVSFDVVIPSLPGFAFSSAPPVNWTVDDTARVFNTLMTQVLGYNKYAVHGTDWGSPVAYRLYNDFNDTVRALHMTFIPFLPATPEALAEEGITLTPDQVFTDQRAEDWLTIGQGYFLEQSTRVRQPQGPLFVGVHC